MVESAHGVSSGFFAYFLLVQSECVLLCERRLAVLTSSSNRDPPASLDTVAGDPYINFPQVEKQQGFVAQPPELLMVSQHCLANWHFQGRA